MSASFESIDNLPQVTPYARVNATEKSKAEDEQESFKRTLKRKMQQKDDEQDDDIERHDTLELTEDKDAEEQGTEHVARQHEEIEVAPEDEEHDENSENDSTDHIDLKA